MNALEGNLKGGWSIFDLPKALYTRAKHFWTGPRQNASPSVRKFIEKNATKTIVEMKVVRTPVQSMIEKIANWLSLGRFSQNKKDLNYDKMFHLYLVMKMSDGSVHRIDKNHVVQVSDADWICGAGMLTGGGKKSCPKDQMVVPRGNGGNIALLLSGGENLVGKEKYWVYNPVSQNCQYFIKWTLEGSGLLNDQLEKFILQDVSKVLKDLDYLGNIATKITNIAGVADGVQHGEGLGIRNHHYAIKELLF
jgi:hypothetical protein